MSQYLRNRFNQQVPQSAPLPGQIRNSADGYSYAVDKWKQLDRFLVLGSEKGSYYVNEKALTLENANTVLACIKEDGLRTVNRIVEISDAGRAPKNDPAIFALAMACSFGNAETKTVAFKAIPKVCRIGTHLFHFAEYVNGMRGWGRGLRKVVADWYNEQEAKELQLQIIKYQQRDGWAHRDMLRLAHPNPVSDSHKTLYHWVTKGWESIGEVPHTDINVLQVWAFEAMRRANDAKEAAFLIRKYRLPRECVPTQFLKDAEVWEALLEDMPLTATVRNLATMTRVGLLTGGSVATNRIVEVLRNTERIKRARVHPLALLNAQRVYAKGKGDKSDNTWDPVEDIVFALQDAFYLAFDNVESTGKRWMLALDVSGSMSGNYIAGMSLDAREASGALAMVTMARENCVIVGFSHELTPLPIHRGMRLDSVLKVVDDTPMGGTDCSLPMLYAMKQRLPVDCFVVYTDNETWAGSIHPSQALAQYRATMGIDAKLIVVGMVSNGFTIADPGDPGMLDVVGFDTATPQLMNNFAADRI